MYIEIGDDDLDAFSVLVVDIRMDVAFTNEVSVLAEEGEKQKDPLQNDLELLLSDLFDLHPFLLVRVEDSYALVEGLDLEEDAVEDAVLEELTRDEPLVDVNPHSLETH